MKQLLTVALLGLLAAAVLILGARGASPVQAVDADLTGDWDVTLTVTASTAPGVSPGQTTPCDLSLTQTDSDVSGTGACGGTYPVDYPVSGSVDAAGAFSLTGTGHMTDPIELDLTLTMTGQVTDNAMSGTYLISTVYGETEGTFEGTREAPPAEEVTPTPPAEAVTPTPPVEEATPTPTPPPPVVEATPTPTPPPPAEEPTPTPVPEGLPPTGSEPPMAGGPDFLLIWVIVAAAGVVLATPAFWWALKRR